MMACIGGADGLTGSGIAVLAHYGPELHADIGKVAFVVALDSNPGNRAAASRLLGACDSDVVLGPARRDTCLASGAPVQIHGHSPSMRHLSLLIPLRGRATFPS